MKPTQPLFPNAYGEAIPSFPGTTLTPPSSLGIPSSSSSSSSFARNLTPPASLERDRTGHHLRNSGSFTVPVRGSTPPIPPHESSHPHQRRIQSGPPRMSPGGMLFDDLAGSDFFSNPVAQMGLSYGQKWAEDASEKYKEGVQHIFYCILFSPWNPIVFMFFRTQITKYLESTNLKYYFNINNSYVPNKLKVLLLPFTHKVSIV